MSQRAAAIRATKAARRWLPSWMQTIRFRLTVTYSAVLFGVAAIVVLGVYLTLTSYLDAQPLEAVEVPKVWKDDQGNWHVQEGSTFRAADIASVEAAANHKTLTLLRELSLQAIAVLFVASLLTGWWLAGRALRPIRQITQAAEEISATDLSRRIGLDGPQDELRRLADSLDGMLGRLDNAFSTQRQIVGDASHELRNPLAVIRANVDAILGQHDVTPEARAHSAAVVVRATGRMTHLVEDLLASARRNSPAFVDIDVDLASVANHVVDEYMVLAVDRHLHVRRDLGTGSVTAGDPRALARAIDNLLSNAVRLAPSGSEITITSGTRDGWAWISVQDQGPGIAQADQERIFNRFFRTSDQPTGNEPNSGLGLAIVRQIIESHDGTITVHSEPGSGSTFTLWLPDRPTPDAERATTPPTVQPIKA